MSIWFRCGLIQSAFEALAIPIKRLRNATAAATLSPTTTSIVSSSMGARRKVRCLTKRPNNTGSKSHATTALNRRAALLSGASLFAVSMLRSGSAHAGPQTQQAATGANTPTGSKPNILVIFGDDIGYWNISAYNRGMMGYRTPNIDRIAREGAIFTDLYAQQSCTAGRAAFITGQSLPHRPAKGRSAGRQGRAV